MHDYTHGSDTMSDDIIARELSEQLAKESRGFPTAENAKCLVDNIASTKESLKKEILRRIVEMSQDRFKHFVDLGGLWFNKDMQDIISELESLGYVYVNGKLYDDVEEFYHLEILYKIKTFHDFSDDDPSILRAVINVPDHFVTKEGDVKQVYKDGIRWSMRIITCRRDISQISVINCKPMDGYGRECDNFFEVTIKVGDE